MLRRLFMDNQSYSVTHGGITFTYAFSWASSAAGDKDARQPPYDEIIATSLKHQIPNTSHLTPTEARAIVSVN